MTVFPGNDDAFEEEEGIIVAMTTTTTTTTTRDKIREKVAFELANEIVEISADDQLF